MENKKPCLTCTMVENPENCDRKSCQVWREWFLKKWGELKNGK